MRIMRQLTAAGDRPRVAKAMILLRRVDMEVVVCVQYLLFTVQ